MIAEHTPQVCPEHRTIAPGWRAGVRRRSALAVLGAIVLSMLSEAHAQSTKTVEQLTSELVSLVAAYQTASDATERARVLDEVSRLAGVRRARLAKLVEDDPGAVLRIALPKKHRDALPPEVQALIEQEEQVEGELEVMYEDGPQGAKLHHHLVTGGRRLALHFAKQPPRLLSGTKVRVKGVRVDGALALGGTNSVEALALASPYTFGEQKTMVLLVNFQDSPVQPYSVTSAQNVLFTQTSDFFRQGSFQQTWLSGDVYGWFTIPMSVSTCDSSILGLYARQAAVAAGIDVSRYQRWVYAFPQNACSWLGFGSLGGSPSQAWINGPFQLQTVSHEMGHNFGLWHAHAVACNDGTTGIDFHTGCYKAEYGDTIDNMGYATGYWGAFNKEQIGWLNYGNSPPIITVQSPGGTYWIDTYETQNGSPKALKVPRPDGSFYYVESRQAIGADAFLGSTPQVLNGVFIRTATPGSGNSGYLYDMTPATPWVFTDGTLGVGKTLNDTTSGVTITPLSVGSGGASVLVSFGSAPPPCTPAAPTLTVSPSQTQWVLPGGTASFSVSLTNRNNAECSVSTYTLQAQAPSGWTVNLSAGPTVTVSPGASVSTQMQVTAPTSAVPGFYTASVAATDSLAPNYSASASGMIAIDPPVCSPATPTLTLSPSQASINVGGAVSLTVWVTNRNSAGCGTSTFNLSPGVPANWTATFSDAALSVSPGASASTTLQVAAPASTAAGSYAVSTIATESANSGNSGSASATITVEAVQSATLNVALSSDQTSYKRGATARLTAIVTTGGTPVASASVVFTIAFPDGRSTTHTKNTDSSGRARVSFQIKSNYPVGVYSVTATATKNGSSGSATVASGSSTMSFTVW